jgi:hypothetical protein
MGHNRRLRPQWFRWVGAVLLVMSALAIPACSGKEEPPLGMGQLVKGKVTYKGEPVPYGFVVLYSPTKGGRDEKSGAFLPLAFGEIREGKYILGNAPTGPVMVCVVTDPDMDPQDVMRPAIPGGFDPTAAMKGKLPKGPDMLKGDMPKAPPIAPPGGSGGVKGPPPDPAALMPGGDPKAGPPGGFPEGFKGPPRNPLTAKFSEDQKSRLREIHAKYGVFGKSPLVRALKEGEQTLNLDLK